MRPPRGSSRESIRTESPIMMDAEGTPTSSEREPLVTTTAEQVPAAAPQAFSKAPGTGVALVTGASSGIGEDTARKLQALGYIVYGAARRTDRLQALTADGIRPLAMDVTDDASMSAVVNRILEETGRIDVLVNNAGFSVKRTYQAEGLDLHHRGIDVMAMDKTGTLTTGRMAVVAVWDESGRVVNISDNPPALAVTAALEVGSEHPISRAIVEACPGVAPAEDFRALPGLGVSGTVNGLPAKAGRVSLFDAIPDTLSKNVERAQAEGRTVLVVGRGDDILGAIAVSDEIKPEAVVAVKRMVQAGVRPVLVTGDNSGAAAHVASELGIGEVMSEVMPADKVDVVTRLRSDGSRVAMMGDGVNDAAALQTADLSIAMGTGADVAIAASDIICTRGDPRLAVDALSLAHATDRTIRQNLFWAFAYNVIAIPVAAVGLLSPVIAAAAMAFSSIFVVTNSMRLVRWHPGMSDSN